jgi:hypothetical protein
LPEEFSSWEGASEWIEDETSFSNAGHTKLRPQYGQRRGILEVKKMTSQQTCWKCHFEIFTVIGNSVKYVETIEADSLNYSPSGFMLCNRGEILDEIIYAVPPNCGVRKIEEV